MLHVMSYALVDTINVLLIGVIVAVGVMLPTTAEPGPGAGQGAGQGTGPRRGCAAYAKIATLLVVGDWLGVLLLALLSLLIFDGIGDAVGTFVDSPLFGILLVLTGWFIGITALLGKGDNTALVERILGPLRTPTVATLGTGLVLGLVQSATSGPFFAGILVMSAGDFHVATRYLGMLLYASVALSLPFLTACGVGYVRRRPASWLGRQFVRMRENSVGVARGAGVVASVFLMALGAVDFL